LRRPPSRRRPRIEAALTVVPGQTNLPEGLAEFAQDQDLGGLARLVGGFPFPCAFGVGRAERRDHRGVQHSRIGRDAAREIGQQPIGRNNEESAPLASFCREIGGF
jgi:hypothetical protein